MERPLRLAALATVVLGLVPLASHSSTLADRAGIVARMPRLVLWAWERPEDLRFVNSEHVGVAFLAGTIHLRGEDFEFRPRLQPLRVSPDTQLVAVVRLEAEPGAALNQRQMDEARERIVKTSSLPQVVAVQIDFDATESQQGFYRALLLGLRQQLPRATPISITALASWCIGGDWIAGLPIDEAVPMLFRMGTGQNEVSSWLGSQRDFREPLCRGSLGISIDEPWKSLPRGRRVYAFSPKPWTQNSVAALDWEMQSWR